MTTFARDGMPANLPGADSPSRYIGATAAGPPTAGPYAVGDFVIDQTGAVYFCTAAGSPGTWSGRNGAPLATSSGTTVTSAGFTNIASGTIAANTATVNGRWDLIMFGHGTWGSTQQTLSLQTQIGGSTIGTTMAVDSTVFAASAAFRWEAKCRLVCTGSLGASATWVTNWTFTATQTANNIIPGTAANNTVAITSGTSSAKTADSTVSESYALQVKWAATTGSPTITQDAFWFTQTA